MTTANEDEQIDTPEEAEEQRPVKEFLTTVLNLFNELDDGEEVK